MEEKRKKCIQWVKEHKAEIIAAGVSVGAVIALLLGLSNWTSIEMKMEDLKKIIRKNPQSAVLTSLVENEVEAVSCATKRGAVRIPHEVRMHPRNLPKGHNPSPSKIALAVEYGYTLLPGQTLVEGYHTGENVT